MNSDHGGKSYRHHRHHRRHSRL